MIIRPARPRTLLIVAGLLMAAGSAAQSQDPYTDLRRQFLQAYAAVQPGTQSPEQSGDESLEGYPLYPYLQAARIQRALAAATFGADAVDDHVAGFLQRYEGTPVAIGLRASWLVSLANRSLWPSFLEQYRDGIVDPALRCHALVARIEAGQTADLLPVIIADYLNPTQLPPPCERAFGWARARGALTPDLVEQRVRRVLAKGDPKFARLLAQPLPADRAAPLLQWAALLEKPRSGIDALLATPGKPVEAAALLAGWQQLVRTDLDYAHSRYETLIRTRHLDRDAASPYALALALRLAWNRDADALRYFARVRPADFDDAALEWQARAALWAADWPTVPKAIAAMSPTARDSTRWRYWSARATEQLGDPAAARERYVSLLATDNYYSAMVAARLGLALTPNPMPVPADVAELARIAALPGFVRVHELLEAGMRKEALAEWQEGVRGLPTDAQPQAIHLGMRWEWYDVSIATATQQRIFGDYPLLYPRPFDTIVQGAAAASGLPTELVYGVLRQESLYRADAVSSAGAIGLLQLMPATARATARHQGQTAPERSALFNPELNTRLGAQHLRELLDQFGGQLQVALAAYNAGPNAALRWLPPTPVAPDIWIENIPYNETRTYVQRILWHSLVFSWLGSGQPQTTRHWLTEISRTVPGRS